MDPVQREALARLRRAAAGSRQERLLHGLRAWGDAAAATRGRQQLVHGAVHRFQYAQRLAGVEAPTTADWWAMIETGASLARAWQRWRLRDRRRPAPLSSEHLAMEAERVAVLREEADRRAPASEAGELDLEQRRRLATGGKVISVHPVYFLSDSAYETNRGMR